eukprot:scaffold69143_cov40-Prasinocladus_malaysianus.AAC.1
MANGEKLLYKLVSVHDDNVVFPSTGGSCQVLPVLDKLYSVMMKPSGPEHPQVHNSIGNLRRRAGQLSEAINAFEAAIELAPDNAQL